MKKVLVLTLVLVMALASSAMAAVSFSGKFTATAEMDTLKPFVDDYELKPGLSFTIGASNKNVTTFPVETEIEVAVLDEDGEETGEFTTEVVTEYESITHWEFTGGLNLVDSKFELGKYKLALYDDYFSAYVWGKGYEHAGKASYFSMIASGAVANDIRARLVVPIMDLVTFTIDLDQPDNARIWAQGSVEGFDLGLAYARKNWTNADEVSDTIVAQVGTDVPAGDISVRLQAAGGVTLGEDLGYGLGFSVDSDVLEELNVNASITHANEHWVGDGTAVVAQDTIISAGATYTETEFEVKASGKYTIKPEGKENTNEATLGAKYRMSETLSYAHLFHASHWFKNDAPAFGLEGKMENVGWGHVRLDATSPVVEDMVWVKGYALYEGGSNFGAGVLGHIIAMPVDKLIVKPQVDFTHEEAEADGDPVTVTDVKLAADYKIGASDATLKFLAQRVFQAVPKSLLKLSIEIPF